MVSPSDRELMRASFAQVALMPDVAGALFYERLFTVNPEFRALFKHDMRIQNVKLIMMLDVIVEHYDDLDEILPALREMGQRHAGYGVKDRDYDAGRQISAVDAGAGTGRVIHARRPRRLGGVL